MESFVPPNLDSTVQGWQCSGVDKFMAGIMGPRTEEP